MAEEFDHGEEGQGISGGGMEGFQAEGGECERQ